MEVNVVSLPGNPTITRLSMNVGGAYEAVSAYEAEVILPLNEPVLICWELLTSPLGNIVGAYEADVANEAVAGVNVIDVAALAVVENDADVGVNVIEVAADAVVANDADITLLAQLLVPINSPVNDPLNDPVLICNEDDMSAGLFATFVYSTKEAVAIVVGLFCIPV